jgi:hypothetical protein
VYGSLVSVNLNQKNEMLAISSSLGEPININPQPRWSENEVIETLRKMPSVSSSNMDNWHPHLFYYFIQPEKSWHLVYMVNDISKKNDLRLSHLVTYVIDAQTGQPLEEISQVKTLF